MPISDETHSSANKCGVICSSYKVLYGLILNEKEITTHKQRLVEQILATLKIRALDEARLLLETRKQSSCSMITLPDEISKQINAYTDQVYNHLKPLTLSPDHPLMQALLQYCPPLLKENYSGRILTDLPDRHQKAIIACHIAARLVYKHGVDWAPSIIDILPIICEDPEICGG